MSYNIHPLSIDWSPTYSVCICNYNMSSTINDSLESVLSQLNERFEVIVVDDGSNDESLFKLSMLQKKYGILRVIPLARDSRRRLGETRNISIRASRGRYCILHIDTDDLWSPFIDSFTRVYHEIEKRMNLLDFMLSGLQIQMATKSLLLQYPYKNVYYVEDRVLWSELAVAGKLISIEHEVMRVRMPIRNFSRKFYKIISTQYSSMKTSFSFSPSPWSTCLSYLKSIFRVSSETNATIFLRVLRLFLLPTTFVAGFILNRQSLVSQSLASYRNLTMLNLSRLEEYSCSKYGLLDLSYDERNLYFLEQQT